MSELRQDIRTHPRAAVLAAMLVVVVWLGVNWFDLATFDHGELPVATLLEWLALPCLAGAVAARAVGGNRGRLLAPVAGVLVILANLALIAYAFRDVNPQDHHVDWDLPLLFGLVGAVLGGLGGLMGAARRHARPCRPGSSDRA
ncbi:MAG: hypothetical protein ACTHMP_14895 [Thermomicrobiales bacterium]